MSEIELPEYRIAKLQMEPGDTLVAKVDEDITLETAERLRAHLKANVSQQIHVLVIGPGVDILQIKPPAPDA